jgi:MipA family protein
VKARCYRLARREGHGEGRNGIGLNRSFIWSSTLTQCSSKGSQTQSHFNQAAGIPMNRVSMMVVLGMGAIGMSQSAMAQQRGSPDGWEVSLGAGIVSSPRSLGSQKLHTIGVPNFDVRYKDWFFANPIQGIGLQTQLSGLTLSAAIGADMNSRDPKAGDRYVNLSKIGAAPAVRLRASYDIGEFSTEAVVSTRLGSSNKGGTTLQLEESYNLYAAAKTLVSVGAAARLMDDRFAKNLVSISSEDSLASGLPVYRAKSGLLDVGLFAQVVYPVSDHWTIFSKVSLNTFEGDARKSPLVERRTAPTALLFASYTF